MKDMELRAVTDTLTSCTVRKPERTILQKRPPNIISFAQLQDQLTRKESKDNAMVSNLINA